MFQLSLSVNQHLSHYVVPQYLPMYAHIRWTHCGIQVGMLNVACLTPISVEDNTDCFVKPGVPAVAVEGLVSQCIQIA